MRVPLHAEMCILVQQEVHSVIGDNAAIYFDVERRTSKCLAPGKWDGTGEKGHDVLQERRKTQENVLYAKTNKKSTHPHNMHHYLLPCSRVKLRVK